MYRYEVGVGVERGEGGAEEETRQADCRHGRDPMAAILFRAALRLPGERARRDLRSVGQRGDGEVTEDVGRHPLQLAQAGDGDLADLDVGDRKSTRLNSSHVAI